MRMGVRLLDGATMMGVFAGASIALALSVAGQRVLDPRRPATPAPSDPICEPAPSAVPSSRKRYVSDEQAAVMLAALIRSAGEERWLHLEMLRDFYEMLIDDENLVRGNFERILETFEAQPGIQKDRKRFAHRKNFAYVHVNLRAMGLLPKDDDEFERVRPTLRGQFYRVARRAAGVHTRPESPGVKRSTKASAGRNPHNSLNLDSNAAGQAWPDDDIRRAA